MKHTILAVILLVGLAVACKKQGAIFIEEYDETAYQVEFANNTLPIANWPSDNPLTIAKVDLGKFLFYDTRLSSDNTISCASCHRQANAFSDTTLFSVGVNGSTGDRQAMAIFNMAWNENEFFWDGRAHLLRHQSLMPIENPVEMNESLPNVIAKLSADESVKKMFVRAFGDTEISNYRLSLALEAFMLSLVSEDSKFDRFLTGKTTLTDSEERGRQLFYAEYNPFFPDVSGADCAHCHAGNNFENDLYMNNGMDTDAQFIDLGRENATNDPADRAKFKVPSLRNIAVTFPYMHDGRFTTLEEVIDHYNEHIQSSSTVDPALLGTNGTGLMLDAQDKQDLINFLHTLTDQSFLTNPAFADPH